MLNLKYIRILFVLTNVSLFFAYAAISTDVNQIKDTITNNLPEGISLPNLDGINVEEVYQKIQDALKQKCVDASGSDAAYDEASSAATAFSECIQNLADFSNIHDEIEKAKPTGDLDLVFNKYCGKRHEALICLERFSNATNPCLNEEERTHKKTFIGIFKRLLEFVCHENGNQIALFIAEEGPECFNSKKDQLIDCMNQTFSKYVTTEVPTLDNLPSFTITQQNCQDMKKFENCVVTELEKCRESTPANLVEALFRYIKKETPCKKMK